MAAHAVGRRQCPFYIDDDKPFLQRHDSMSLDIVRPKDIPRGKIMFPKDEDNSLKTQDIHKCQPHYPHLHVLNKPDVTTGCTDLGYVGTKARTLYPPMDRKARDLSLTTADIEYAQPKVNPQKGNRHTDPLCPNYELPSSYKREHTPPRFNGRHTHDVSDIDFCCPRKLIPDRNYARNPNDSSDIAYAQANYEEKMRRRTQTGRVDRSLNVKDISGAKPHRPRCTNPLEPTYQVPTHATTSLHAKFSEEAATGVQLAPKEGHYIGDIHGSKPRKLQWDNAEPQFSLLREDIAGTVPQRWVGAVPCNIYDPPEVKPMISFHDPHDIPGAQVGSLKKGIEGATRRQCNPLNPSYPLLDGNQQPHPVPVIEAERGYARERHPMLRSQNGASSLPNLRGSDLYAADDRMAPALRRDASAAGPIRRGGADAADYCGDRRSRTPSDYGGRGALHGQGRSSPSGGVPPGGQTLPFRGAPPGDDGLTSHRSNASGRSYGRQA